MKGEKGGGTGREGENEEAELNREGGNGQEAVDDGGEAGGDGVEGRHNGER